MIGKIGQYTWYDLDEMNLREALNLLGNDLVGLHAVNTSFDSGPYPLRTEDVEAGWQSVNGHATSPKITDSMLEAWPLSHDEYCDEWWFFTSVPQEFSCPNAFCNYLGMRIKDWRELEFEGGLMLLRSVELYKPKFILGNNEWTYLISNKNIPNMA